MDVASGCGEQEVGVASGSGWNLWACLARCGWNLWVWLVCVVIRRYIDFLILLIPTPLVSVLFCSSIIVLQTMEEIVTYVVILYTYTNAH